MNEIAMTLVGNVVDDPTVRVTNGGHKVANFRLASTPRRYDRESGQWVNMATFFVTVSAWRALADNVEASIRKGQPVIVTGRYQTRTFEVNETIRVAHELEATALGHDLNRGMATFSKRSRPSSTNEVEMDPSGIPADQSDRWFNTPAAENADAFSGELAATSPLSAVDREPALAS